MPRSGPVNRAIGNKLGRNLSGLLSALYASSGVEAERPLYGPPTEAEAAANPYNLPAAPTYRGTGPLGFLKTGPANAAAANTRYQAELGLASKIAEAQNLTPGNIAEQQILAEFLKTPEGQQAIQGEVLKRAYTSLGGNSLFNPASREVVTGPTFHYPRSVGGRGGGGDNFTFDADGNYVPSPSNESVFLPQRYPATFETPIDINQISPEELNFALQQEYGTTGGEDVVTGAGTNTIQQSYDFIKPGQRQLSDAPNNIPPTGNAPIATTPSQIKQEIDPYIPPTPQSLNVGGQTQLQGLIPSVGRGLYENLLSPLGKGFGEVGSDYLNVLNNLRKIIVRGPKESYTSLSNTSAQTPEKFIKNIQQPTSFISFGQGSYIPNSSQFSTNQPSETNQPTTPLNLSGFSPTQYQALLNPPTITNPTNSTINPLEFWRKYYRKRAQ